MSNMQYPGPKGLSVVLSTLLKLNVFGGVVWGGISLLVGPFTILNVPDSAPAYLFGLQIVAAIVLVVAGACTAIAGTIWLMEEGKAPYLLSSRRQIAANVCVIAAASLFIAWVFSSMVMFE
ncbi:MAG: hypothetical protein COW29_05475 [Rhodobacterales bacterium CG15_BIG_FIL_POST_REV_8_21_14_020_59_13]|nr:MAG: hypothetical protein COW29_05475 [Rhodobacterales bacterium CG15_BIG_FIL_POST_REV_8_21_14_020_59_13]